MKDSKYLHINPNYLDASAAVKLVVNEAGAEALRNYFESRSNFRMTVMSVAETFGALKLKFLRKEIDEKQYFNSAILLAAYINEKIDLNKEGLHDPNIVWDCQQLAAKHKIDLADALQLLVIKKGPMRVFVGESAPILITADTALAKAARTEGFKVWDCLKEVPPN